MTAVRNPASGSELGLVAHAGIANLDSASAAARRGFATWRDLLPSQRSEVMRQAAGLLRDRADVIARLLTQV